LANTNAEEAAKQAMDIALKLVTMQNTIEEKKLLCSVIASHEALSNHQVSAI
jgi:hypothetical protein